MSGVDLERQQLRKGAADAVKALVEEQGGRVPAQLDDEVVQRVAEQGGTPLVVAQDNFALGVIHLKDIVKGGMRERFDELRRDGDPHGDDHRRQPCHRRRDRRRRPASTTSSPRRRRRRRWR